MIRIIAIICQIASPDVCMQQTVTNSDLAAADPHAPPLTMTVCLNGLMLPEWMKQHPGYRLAKWRCSIGGKEREHA